MKLLLIAGMLLGSAAMAQTVIPSFIEDSPEKNQSESALHLKRASQSTSIDLGVLGSLRKNYEKISSKIRVPGTVSSAPMAEFAKIAGPVTEVTSFRMGDTVFLRWLGAPGPRIGDRYATYTPAIVLQSLQDPTDFSVVLKTKKNESNERYRRAGYFYESTGTVRITRINQGIVEAVIEDLSGQVAVGDQLMPVLPTLAIPKPIIGGIQLSAAIVSGAPAERLSTTPRSFVYINRGARDGIRIGRVFQSIETAKLEGMREGPEMLAGEAIVVHVSDSFSVAMITRQFEVIRIGSLLKSKQNEEDMASLQPLRGLNPKEASAAPEAIPEVPSMENFQQDTTLPEPNQPAPQPKQPSLSELDAIEKSQNFNALSQKEKERLSALSRQENVSNGSEDEDEAPPLAPMDNSFGPQQKPKKAAPKKAHKTRDEEELNQLMMQN
jgi:hypothetical protein